MSYKNSINCTEGNTSNKLDKYIKDHQGGVVTLPERQFNCPACIKSKTSTCKIPSWMKPPCDDGIKCFNCPPKYLCFDASCCHFVNADEEQRRKSN